jgi:hypothetical protein
MTDFPDHFFRGITSSKWVHDDGSVDPQAFQPYTSDSRSDGGQEISINWDDDEPALTFTLTQRNDKGHLMFQAGVVQLPRSECDRINSSPAYSSMLYYERDDPPNINNPYHGNIVLHTSLLKHHIRSIQGALAIASSKVITRAK